MKEIDPKDLHYEPFYRCFACGGELIWDSDFMASELGECDDEKSEDTVVNILHCKDCGATVKVYHNK